MSATLIRVGASVAVATVSIGLLALNRARENAVKAHEAEVHNLNSYIDELRARVTDRNKTIREMRFQHSVERQTSARA